MREPDWAKVLEYLYEKEESIEFVVGRRISDSHEITATTGLSSERVHELLPYMEGYGLLKLDYKEVTGLGGTGQERGEIASYSLSTDGFEVAHERELKRGEVYRNQLIGIFTILLGTGAFLQGFLALFPSIPSGGRVIVGIAAIVLIISGLIVLDSTIE